MLDEDVRRCLTRVFPYGVLYTIHPNFVPVVAVIPDPALEPTGLSLAPPGEPRSADGSAPRRQSWPLARRIAVTPFILRQLPRTVPLAQTRESWTPKADEREGS